MEKNKLVKTDLVSWVKDKWAHSPIFSTLLALLAMVLVQSVVMTNLAGSFGGMFGKMGMAWLNILRNNTYAGVIALGMCFVIISGGIDLSVGSMLCSLGAMLMYMLDENAGPLAAMGHHRCSCLCHRHCGDPDHGHHHGSDERRADCLR